MKQPLFLLALLALLFSCKKDGPDDMINLVSNRIRFDFPEVGQVSRYVGLNGYNYFDGGYDDFEYTTDTLRLEIIAEDSNGYKVAETLRYISWSNNGLSWNDSTLYYYLRVSNDTLKIVSTDDNYIKSRVFGYNAKRHGIQLQKITSPQVQILGWKTNVPYCECYNEGFAKNYKLFVQTFSHLNVIVDNSQMANDGNGETYIFSKSYGFVRFSTYSPWTMKGNGWDLLPLNSNAGN